MPSANQKSFLPDGEVLGRYAILLVPVLAATSVVIWAVRKAWSAQTRHRDEDEAILCELDIKQRYSSKVASEKSLRPLPSRPLPPPPGSYLVLQIQEPLEFALPTSGDVAAEIARRERQDRCSQGKTGDPEDFETGRRRSYSELEGLQRQPLDDSTQTFRNDEWNEIWRRRTLQFG